MLSPLGSTKGLDMLSSPQRSLRSGDPPTGPEAHPDPSLADEGFLLSALLDHVQNGIYFKDLESRFILINKAQARTLGLGSENDAIGKSDFDFFTNEHAQSAFHDEQEIIRSGQPILD